MDWTKLTNDPLDQSTAHMIREHLKGISKLYSRELVSYFCDIAKEKNTLHIGCYEHDEKYLNSEAWKHKSINDVAKSCTGLDINKNGVEHMKSLGYDAVHADATSEIDLGKLFDTIIAGDVIEHVDNISGLIRFSSKHLSANGKLYLSTPNPFYIGHVLSAWTNRPTVANFEHTTWLSESTMLEVARRSGLTLEEIIYPIGNSYKSIFFRWAKKITFKFRSTMLFTTIVYRMAKKSH